MPSKGAVNKWIEIHLDAIENNLVEIRRHLSGGAVLIAVIKGDAYGMGAGEIAHTLSLNGVDYFAVTFLHEALALRARGRNEEILIMSPLAVGEAREALDKDCILTVASFDDLSAAEKAAADRIGRSARIHIIVDSDMGGFGKEREDIIELVQMAAASSNVIIEGIYTHFSAPGDDRLTIEQFHRFESIVDEFEDYGINIPMKHCCSSSTFLKHPFMHMDAVRIGTLIGGRFPRGLVDKTMRLRDPYHFKAKVVSVRHQKKGSFVGYNRTYQLSQDARIAVVAAGFADGLGLKPVPIPTGLGVVIKLIAKNIATYLDLKQPSVTVDWNGQKGYLRGQPFLQLCEIEFPPGIIIQPGDEVELPVPRTLASRAIPRIYYRDGLPGKIEYSVTRLSYQPGEE